MKNKSQWSYETAKIFLVGDILGHKCYFKHPVSGRWRKAKIRRISLNGVTVVYSGDLISFVKWEKLYS